MGLGWVVQDLRFGIRILRRAPGFALSAIGVLALAVAVNACIFSVIEAVLLRPLPYADASRLCVLWKSIPQRNIEWDWTSALTIRDWRERSQSFEDVAFVLRPEGSRVMLRGESAMERVQASIVSGNFFDLLGMQPILGRTFSAAEDVRGDQVAVLSYGFWQRRFGATPAVLGQKLVLDGRSVAVIGVMPKEFQFPDHRAELWLPLGGDPRWATFQNPQFRIADAFCAVGRLRAGKSFEDARVEMRSISERLARQYPATDSGLGVRVVPMEEQIAGSRLRRSLWILWAAALCVLLIACSNVASLLVARGTARSREMRIRAALGAGRWRLLRQLAAENLLLSAAGGSVGVALAYAGLGLLLRLAPELPRADGIGLNGTVLVFSFGLCVVTGVVFGLLLGHRIGRAAPRLRGMFVAVQYALAIVLLTGAGLLVRSFLLLNAVDPGFDTARLLTLDVAAPARGDAFFDEAIRRAEAMPGVAGAATGTAVFDSFAGNSPNENIVVEGRTAVPEPFLHARNVVSDGFFRVLGIPLLAGRLFDSRDGGASLKVAVINERMARQFWPGKNAIGQRFQEVLPGMTSAEWLTVAGVVKDVVYNRDGFVLPVFYLPSRQRPETARELVIRTVGDPRGMAAAVRANVQEIDPSLPRFEIATVEDRLAGQDRARRFETELIGIFACLALVLAATGLYGLMAYSVVQRSKEIGIRMALGATRRGVAGIILREGLRWGIGGIVLGAVGAIALGRVLSGLLYRVSPTDPVTLAVVSALLLIVMLAASAIPAFRAASVDLSVTLRHE